MKAIETRYKGYRFRSRLEARWAVFFDALGTQWRYEVEGYELPSGRYLPDFLLLDTLGDGFPWWFEVKGAYPSEDEARLMCELCRHTQQHGILAWGDVWTGMRFCFFGQDDLWSDCGPMGDGRGLDFYIWGRDVAAIERAVAAARSARFEHGESGPT